MMSGPNSVIPGGTAKRATARRPSFGALLPGLRNALALAFLGQRTAPDPSTVAG